MTRNAAIREANRVAERARQEVYRNSPEAKATRLARIGAGLCFIESDVCVTHNTVADFDHYLAKNPRTTAQGFAAND